MTNIIAEIIGGFVGGLIAGIIGYATDISISAIFQAFGTLIPLMILLGFVYSIISFFAGISEAYIAGLFFTLGVISAGWLLADFVTLIAGFISIAGLVLSPLMGNRHGY
jgi:hypothetical protein